ncbi:MAG: Protein TusB [Candidatus Celerinatantimonas neptuna]|nr:MAG: Protein TusB [Candidatus Celerinatantimonas neptuna]
MLHILRDGRYSGNGFLKCSKAITSEDRLLLIENAVYLPQFSIEMLVQLNEQNRLFLLSDDVQARGLIYDDSYQLISMAQWVELTEMYTPTLTWSMSY